MARSRGRRAVWETAQASIGLTLTSDRSGAGDNTSSVVKESDMQLSEIRINLCGGQAGRLKAFCSLTFDNTFVIRDVKLIEGNDGLFLAMPSRKLCDRCRRCSEKNHLRARFCNNCGTRLEEQRFLRNQNGNTGGHTRLKLHADIA